MCAPRNKRQKTQRHGKNRLNTHKRAGPQGIIGSSQSEAHTRIKASTQTRSNTRTLECRKIMARMRTSTRARTHTHAHTNERQHTHVCSRMQVRTCAHKQTHIYAHAHRSAPTGSHQHMQPKHSHTRRPAGTSAREHVNTLAESEIQKPRNKREPTCTDTHAHCAFKNHRRIYDSAQTHASTHAYLS